MHVLLIGPEFEENLSLRYLAAALQQAGHTASLARFDSPEYADGVVQQALHERPALIGLSMVFQVRAREFCDLARALRAAGYSGHITAGGHFATFACEPLLRDIAALDSIVRQEGEQTLIELAAALERGETGEQLARIPGMVVRDSSGQVVLASNREQVHNLDTIPFPMRPAVAERHLGVPTAYLVGSRGCYADCEYCCIFAWHEAAVGKRYRMRTVGNIADEMALLYRERGIRFFVFHDDNFFLPTAQANRKRFEALNAEIKARNLNDIGLMLKLRPNDCDRDNILLLREMGLMRVFVGIENASPRQMRSLGRDTRQEDIATCLNTLREFGIYATFNILLFDPYTTLDDVETNLQFLRDHSFYPFNWCKVEPYAGTELEKRYGREGRLRGDYFGCDYTMDDPQARALYDLLLPAFYYRNFNYYGLANLNIGLGYHRQLLRHFYPNQFTSELDSKTQRLIEAINGDALDLMERACVFVRATNPSDTEAYRQFSETLRRDSFRSQRTLGADVEALQQAIERAAGVRPGEAGSVPVAFVPLSKAPAGSDAAESGRAVETAATRAQSPPSRTTPPLPPNSGGSRIVRELAPPRIGGQGGRYLKEQEAEVNRTRRMLLRVLSGSVLWLMTGCQQEPPNVPTGQAAPVTAPEGVLRVADGSPDTVAGWEPMILEAVLQPDTAQVIGEPRLTTTGGRIGKVEPGQDKRRLRITYYPEGGSAYSPNETISVAWTVRSGNTDTVILARAFVHVNEDGSYAFGYATPRATIAEMAASPISQGPNP